VTKEAPKKPRGIQSLETGLSLLDEVARFGGPIALSVLSRKVDMPASQVHRYLVSLVSAGVIKQDVLTGHYDLDSGSLRIGIAALARIDVFREADRVFSALAHDTGKTTLFAIWGEQGPVVVRWFAGNPPVITPIHIGSTLPLIHSAIGHVFFAFGDRSTMDAMAERELRPLKHKIPLEELRRNVLASRGTVIDSILIPGLRVAAAPVFDLQGSLALVAISLVRISISDETEDNAMREALHRSCRAVTEAIGGRWFDNEV